MSGKLGYESGSSDTTSSASSKQKSEMTQAEIDAMQKASTTGTTTATNTTQQGSSLGTTGTSATGTETAQRDPWAAALPFLQDYLSQVGSQTATAGQTTAGQQSALDRLNANAATGAVNPYANDYERIAQDAFGTQSRAGDVGTAYGDAQRRLSGTANGDNLDLGSNPYIQSMVQQATDRARNAVNDGFAASGRLGSGANSRALGTGIADSVNNVLFGQFNAEQGRSDAAARDLYQYGTNAATTQDSLDAAARNARAGGLDVRTAGLNTAGQAYGIGNLGPQQSLDLATQLRNQKSADLSQIGNQLLPAAGLGSTTTGTSASDQQQIARQKTMSELQSLTQQQIDEIISQITAQQIAQKSKTKTKSTGTSSTDTSGFSAGLASFAPKG